MCVKITTEKLKEVSKQWGFEKPQEFIHEFLMSGIVPGICMNNDCNYTTDVEIDQSRGHCESCNTKTVKSGLMLAGY